MLVQNKQTIQNKLNTRSTEAEMCEKLWDNKKLGRQYESYAMLSACKFPYLHVCIDQISL